MSLISVDMLYGELIYLIQTETAVHKEFKTASFLFYHKLKSICWHQTASGLCNLSLYKNIMLESCIIYQEKNHHEFSTAESGYHEINDKHATANKPFFYSNLKERFSKKVLPISQVNSTTDVAK